MKILIQFLFIVFFSFLSPAQKKAVATSNKEGWHKIGATKVGFKMKVESFLVLGADKFKSIRLKITHAPVNITALFVYYDSGGIEDFTVKNELNEGDISRLLTLDPKKRIKKISFSYKTLPNPGNRKARIELWGLN